MLHGLIDDVKKILELAPRYTGTVLQILEDPALPTFAARINVLHEMEEAKAPTRPGLPGPKAPPGMGKGIGLARLMKPLDRYIYVRKHPWVLWAAGIGTVLVIGGVGFGLGRRSKRK